MTINIQIFTVYPDQEIELTGFPDRETAHKAVLDMGFLPGQHCWDVQYQDDTMTTVQAFSTYDHGSLEHLAASITDTTLQPGDRNEH